MGKPKTKPKETPAQIWKQENPLLSTHVPRDIYEEVRRRAAVERRSISQFLAIFLEGVFKPTATPKEGT